LPTNQPLTRYDLDVAALAEQLQEWGEPKFRARQVWHGLYTARKPLEALTDIGPRLRDRLVAQYPLAFQIAAHQKSTDGQTAKWLWQSTHDGAQIETVLMQYPDRATVCVSSQAGCAMGCTFCATGQAGFERQLTRGEIVEQVTRAAHSTDQRVGNVVFMGMGEPLANFDAVWGAVERLHDDVGISARRMTISTVGVVPGMRRLLDVELPVTLAVSLHAPTDEQRAELIPLNDRYPIAEVLAAAADVSASKGRRVTFEYACIAGVNDSGDDAAALADLLAGFPAPGGAHVNLIPLNPTDQFSGRAPGGRHLRDFQDQLTASGITATVRQNRGVDIDAACGQLRTRVASTEQSTIPEPT
jgi:23S rRNA (adenine2503-C2)-methyltransferase